LPSTFISHITRKDNVDTVYLCLRGMVSLKRQGVESGVFSAVLSNISEHLSQEQFVDFILESTGVKVKSVHFKPFLAKKLSAIVNLESQDDFQKIAALVQDEVPLVWNANMPLFLTGQAAVYSQAVEYGAIEQDVEISNHFSARTDASDAVLSSARVMCSKFSHCSPVDRSVLQPNVHCFVPAASLHSFCSETPSLMLCIQFIKDPTSQVASFAHVDQFPSLAVQARYFWSAIPSWKPHQFRMRAGNEETAKRHYSCLERPVVRLLDITHSELKPFLNQARVSFLNFFAVYILPTAISDAHDTFFRINYPTCRCKAPSVMLQTCECSLRCWNIACTTLTPCSALAPSTSSLQRTLRLFSTLVMLSHGKSLRVGYWTIDEEWK
jgi:hypothetical protein